jgi:3,4-dihydroxy 2-butanone 4-phosphate synthase/GTP cyclohydrolase II
MVKKEIEIQLPTNYGNFSSSIYKDREGKEHILMIHEKTDLKDSVILRIHSECLAGDLFHSLKFIFRPSNRAKNYIMEQKKIHIVRATHTEYL